MFYYLYTILAVVWAAMWIAEVVYNGNCDYGILACGLASFALSEINRMNDGK